PAAAPPRATPIRFVFQTAADGHFASVSRELAVAIGATAAAWTGRTFGEIAAEAGIDPDGPLARAFAGQDTWTSLSLQWPDPAARSRRRHDGDGRCRRSGDCARRGTRGTRPDRPQNRALAPESARRARSAVAVAVGAQCVSRDRAGARRPYRRRGGAAARAD